MAGHGEADGQRERRGHEVYVGLTTDDPFGPVITFGAGAR